MLLDLLSLEVMQEDLKFTNKEVNELKDEFKEKEEELKSIKGLSYSDSTIVDKLAIDLVSSKSISGHIALEGPELLLKCMTIQKMK